MGGFWRNSGRLGQWDTRAVRHQDTEFRPPPGLSVGWLKALAFATLLALAWTPLAASPLGSANQHVAPTRDDAPALLRVRAVGQSARLPSDLRWLVVASRQSVSEAIAYARVFSRTVSPALVVPSTTGWYAVLAGELDMPKGDANLDNLKGMRLIPQDSYLSTGGKFGPVVWSGYPSAGSIDVMDQRAVQRTVTRLQNALAALGLYSDPVDGLLGRNTVRAWAAYETRAGRTIRGEGFMTEEDIARVERDAYGAPRPSPPSVASPLDPSTFYAELDRDVRERLQWFLMWAGHYEGMIDGAIGPATLAAIRAYQRSTGGVGDAILTPDEVAALSASAGRAFDTADWRDGTDPRAGLGFGLPYAVVSGRGDSELGGGLWASDDGRFRVETFVFEGVGAAGLDGLADAITREFDGVDVSYRRTRKELLVLVGHSATEDFYLRALLSENEIRGVWVWADKALARSHNRYVTAIANSLRLSPRERRTEPPPPDRSSAPVAVGSGTGFIVRGDGRFVTNAHVVEGCREVTVGGFGKAEIVAKDDGLDLALLHVPGVFGLTAAPLAEGAAELGEDVFAYGFPLTPVLGEGLGASSGSVSSTTGLKGDARQLRMTADIQPGNSGGPLLDRSGRVVGVVVSKLDTEYAMREFGTVPQGVNFAIKAGELAAFLNTHGVEIDRVERAGDLGGAALATRARAFTYLVTCMR